MKFNKSKKKLKGNNSEMKTNFYKPKLIIRRNHSNEEYKVNDIHDKIKDIKNVNYDKLMKPKKNIGCQTYYEFPYKNKNYISQLKLHRSKSAIGLLGTRFSSTKNKNSFNYLNNILLQSGNINTIILDKTTLKSVILSEIKKRGKQNLKNNFIFKNKNDINDLYKMMHEYDLSVDYNKNSTILKRYNVDNTPFKEKLYRSYQKNPINNKIFNINKNYKIIIPFKKIYKNKFSFRNHISII